MTPLQGIAGPYGINAGVGQGQSLQIGAQGPGQAGGVAAQHGRGEIKGDQIGVGEALL